MNWVQNVEIAVQILPFSDFLYNFEEDYVKKCYLSTKKYIYLGILSIYIMRTIRQVKFEEKMFGIIIFFIFEASAVNERVSGMEK